MFINFSDKDISDSIRYASYIQAALLPDMNDFKNNFPDSFIFYKPRNIVSGDFYWIVKNHHRIAVTAADCTGHGVPGAFMSIMGINFLNQVTAGGIPESNKILNNLREYVMRALHQKGSENEQKDGMDMALCVIDTEKKHIEFSGAYNPLIYFYRDEQYIIKGDRMPIGIDPVEEQSFSKHVIPFDKIDTFYLFSDGYPDQFGGYNYKKLKFKGFKKILRQAHVLPFSSQEEFLKKELRHWQRQYDQIDDILVIGIGLESFKK